MPDEQFWKAGLPLAASFADAQAAGASSASRRRLKATSGASLPEVGWIPKTAMYGVTYDRLKCPKIHALCNNASLPTNISNHLPRDPSTEYDDFQAQYYCLGTEDEASCTFMQPDAAPPVYIDLGPNCEQPS